MGSYASKTKTTLLKCHGALAPLPVSEDTPSGVPFMQETFLQTCRKGQLRGLEVLFETLSIWFIATSGARKYFRSKSRRRRKLGEYPVLNSRDVVLWQLNEGTDDRWASMGSVYVGQHGTWKTWRHNHLYLVNLSVTLLFHRNKNISKPTVDLSTMKFTQWMIQHIKHFFQVFSMPLPRLTTKQP